MLLSANVLALKSAREIFYPRPVSLKFTQLSCFEGKNGHNS